jgi:hypothetical protein
VDAVADFTGSAADDVFNATSTTATTVNSGDAIDGGAGKDTLNITATATTNNSLSGLTATSIETVNIAGANNLGASSPVYAAALDAKAVTAAALASAQSSLVVAAGRENAATALAAQLAAGITVGTSSTTIASGKSGLTESIAVGASTATVTTAAQQRAAAEYIDNVVIGTATDSVAKAALETITSTTTVVDAVPTGVKTFTLAQYKAAAAAALVAADGSALTAGTGSAINSRATVLLEAATAVDLAAKSTAVDLATAVQQKAAADYIKNVTIGTATDSVAKAALETITSTTTVVDAVPTGVTSFTLAQYKAAAAAALVADSGIALGTTTGTTMGTRAAVLVDIADALVAYEQAHGDFTIGQLNAVATDALSSSTGSTLRTNLDDGVAMYNRAGAKATDAGTVLTSAATAANAAAAADAAAASAVTVALASVGATSVAASQFADATAITLSGSSSKANVTAVAATQTIGFSSVTSMENAVTFGGTVAAGSIAASGSSGALTVTGATMASLNVSGTGTGTAGIALTDGGQAVSATGADTIKALNLTTSGSTVINTTGMSALTSVTQTGAGAVTLNSASTATQTGLATVTTGAGADNVRITTATAVDNLGTSIDETVNASVSTGAGADRVLVATGASGSSGKTTVDTGADNDTIILTSIGTGANSLSGGAGNDTFRIGNISAIATTTISGGDGTDVLRTTQAGTYTATDYTTLVANVSSIETLQLAGATSVTLDASKVAVNRIEFLGTGTNTVTEVSSTQALAAVRTADAVESFGIAATTAAVVTNITATSKGYVLDNDAGLAGNQTVFGDNLNIAMTHVADNSTVVANGNALTLSVAALGAISSASTTTGANVTGIDSQVTLSGDVKSVVATLTSARGVGAVDATAALGAENVAKFAITLDSNGEATASATRTLGNLETVTVVGAGVVTIDTRTDLASTAAKLTTINLSGMTALADLNPSGQEWNGTTVGLYANKSTSLVTLDNDVVETVVLGGAKDTVETTSTYAKADTITGFQLVASAADPLVADASRSDVLKVGGTNALTASNAAKMTVTGSTLEAALLQAASLKAANGTTNIDNVVFNFGGDTYFFKDLSAGGTSVQGLDDGDILVKMSGNLNLDLLLTSITIA